MRDWPVIRIEVRWLMIGLVALALIALIVVRVLADRNQQVRQANAERLGAESMQVAGKAAVATVLEQAKREVALADLVREAAKEIDDAPSPEAARAATLSAACQLQLYRDDPACAVR